MKSSKMEYGYIAVEGNIGSGKTSLSKMLAKQYNAELVLEEFEENEFLPRFYKDPKRYAFTLEMSFLAERYRQLSGLSSYVDIFQNVRVSDYLLSKSLIFAATNLKDDELRLFRKVFDIMFKTVPTPDILIYLYADADRLMHNIRKRGRRYEQSISKDYLNLVQSKYLDFLRKQASTMRIVIVNVSEVDFVKDNLVYEKIVAIVEAPRSNGIYQEAICPSSKSL